MHKKSNTLLSFPPEKDTYTLSKFLNTMSRRTWTCSYTFSFLVFGAELHSYVHFPCSDNLKFMLLKDVDIPHLYHGLHPVLLTEIPQHALQHGCQESRILVGNIIIVDDRLVILHLHRHKPEHLFLLHRHEPNVVHGGLEG